MSEYITGCSADFTMQDEKAHQLRRRRANARIYHWLQCRFYAARQIWNPWDVKYSQPSGFCEASTVVSDVFESHLPGCGVTVAWLKGYYKLYERAGVWAGLRRGDQNSHRTTMNSFLNPRGKELNLYKLGRHLPSWAEERCDSRNQHTVAGSSHQNTVRGTHDSRGQAGGRLHATAGQGLERT